MTVKRSFAFSAAYFIVALFLAGCAANSVTPAQESISHYKMGLNRMQSGNDDSALYEFNTAIQKDSSNANAHFAAGIVYMRQKNLDAAEREFKKTLSIDSKFADAHNNLGLVYVNKKDYGAAIKEFKAATNDTRDFPDKHGPDLRPHGQKRSLSAGVQGSAPGAA
jgi:Tfp pilus assembly protein PilF